MSRTESITVSAERAELEELLQDLIPLAHLMLRQYGEFLPYGGAVAADGRIIRFGSQPRRPRATAQELIDETLAAFRQEAVRNSYRAIALVFRGCTRIRRGGRLLNVIHVYLEHCSGYAVSIFFPYKISMIDGVNVGNAFARRGKPRVWS